MDQVQCSLEDGDKNVGGDICFVCVGGERSRGRNVTCRSRDLIVERCYVQINIFNIVYVSGDM